MVGVRTRLWLLTVTHPENGTMLFLYNADGSVDWKTDAKGRRWMLLSTATGV